MKTYLIAASFLCVLLLASIHWYIMQNYTLSKESLIDQALQAIKTNEYDHALVLLNQILEVEPNHASALECKVHVANLYQEKNQLSKSAKIYSQLIKQGKATISTYHNFAYALSHLGLHTEALTYYLQVLSHQPNNARAHYGIAEIYLTQGDFKRGWKEFEWRVQGPRDIRNFKNKCWDGISNISEKTILTRCEYGLGDTLQFIRYVRNLKELGATVYAEIQPQLVPLLSMCPYIDKIIPAFSSLPPFDFQIRLMSLASIFSSNEKSIPAQTPYIKANPELINHWKSKFEMDKNIKVGLCWTGNKHYDNSLSPLSRRAISPLLFKILLNKNGFSLYSLQTPDINRTCDAELKINFFEDNFDKAHGNFMDTAAVIMNLDLVITIDTSIAHLAGALGKPAWVILPYVADWRWQCDRDDSPWYPPIRLFRQKKPGDWNMVLNVIGKELDTFIKA